MARFGIEPGTSGSTDCAMPPGSDNISILSVVQDKLPVPERPTDLDKSIGQGPTALTVGAGGGLFGHFFSRLSYLFSFTLSLGDGSIHV